MPQQIPTPLHLIRHPDSRAPNVHSIRVNAMRAGKPGAMLVSYVVEGLAPATYYFAVTAIDAHGAESARSNAGRKEIS